MSLKEIIINSNNLPHKLWTVNLFRSTGITLEEWEYIKRYIQNTKSYYNKYIPIIWLLLRLGYSEADIIKSGINKKIIKYVIFKYYVMEFPFWQIFTWPELLCSDHRTPCDLPPEVIRQLELGLLNKTLIEIQSKMSKWNEHSLMEYGILAGLIDSNHWDINKFNSLCDKKGWKTWPSWKKIKKRDKIDIETPKKTDGWDGWEDFIKI